MGFLSLLLLWPLLMATWLLSLLDIALPVIMRVLLGWNIFVLAVLLLIFCFWKKSGTMDRLYINTLGGWKKVLLLILKYGLLVFIIWEIILVLACAAYLIWQPSLL